MFLRLEIRKTILNPHLVSATYNSCPQLWLHIRVTQEAFKNDVAWALFHTDLQSLRTMNVQALCFDIEAKTMPVTSES